MGGKRSQSAAIRAAAARPLERQVSEKHVRRACVTRPAVISPSSAALVYHVQKPQRAFFFSFESGCGGREGGVRFANAPVHVHAHLQTPTSPAQARPHNTLSVFPPGKLGEVLCASIWAKTGSNI